MTIQRLKEQLPDFAKDTKLNLSKYLSGNDVEGLTTVQVYGIALASAYAIQHEGLIDAVLAQVKDNLTAEVVNAAKIAASIMAMNNTYYRFVHQVSDSDYAKLPAQLRMNAMANPGIEKVDFELMALAVSAFNGCGMCMDAHTKELVKRGVSKPGVQSAIRIAAVLNAAAQTLVIEAASGQ